MLSRTRSRAQSQTQPAPHLQTRQTRSSRSRSASLRGENQTQGPVAEEMQTQGPVPAPLAPRSPRQAPWSPKLTSRLPLSPRKRTSDDNVCNIGVNLLGSPPKQSRPSLASPRKLGFDENSPVFSPKKLLPASPKPLLPASPKPLPPASPKTLLPASPKPKQSLAPASSKLPLSPASPKLPFYSASPQLPVSSKLPLVSPTSSPADRPSTSRLSETPSGSPSCPGSRKKAPVVRLFAEKSRYQSVKQALHTAVPPRLLSREAECSTIRSFLEDRLLQPRPSSPARPGSLYISGAPGTGKTACLNCVLQDMKEELKEVRTVVVNCMTLRSSHGIFPLLAEQLGASASHSHSKLQKLLTSPGPAVLLVLDEMDQLDSKAQDVLYTIFEWPYLPKSRLCLVGIANALDLTDRILPRLQAMPHCLPQLLHFTPYSRLELTAIVQDRLTQVSGEEILDASAVQFCARKVSAVSGDARKALDICRRAVEIVESDDRKGSEAKTKAARVSVPQVMRVLSEVYGDRMAAPSSGEESFPLQQKLLVCCLLLLASKAKSKELPLGKLHEAYSRLCSQRQVASVGQAECLSLCSLLESRGIFALKKAKEARLTKVSLKIEERDVENALKDRTLLGSILATGLP